ncbi:uncharacterized protein PAC_19793 [Phialocephala subalpina]|uniref:Uncharacterized protein n=1 Tax=Phialocephala subalpina TaxID=576137 RepID=A0A1L7XXU5_9HELO|nr:uncharacterized protein PAC_19793 [Phialocephala subalpina]
MWGSTITWQQLSESISRLRLLNEVPEGPRENSLTCEGDSHHCLSISRENEIASNLAFLSATSDDSLKVMAVCVEEHSNGKGITLRIASNTGDLSTVTSGLRIIAQILERAARRESPRAEDKRALFRQVVSLDVRQILSRLRSRHAKRTQKTVGKPAVIHQLNEVLNDKSIKAGARITEERLTGLRDNARTLQGLFARLEIISDPSIGTVEVRELLEEIVKAAHEITMAADLSLALQTFSGNPSLIAHLPEAIGKLGRYYSICSELVAAARDKTCGAFRNIQVEPFQIEMPASVGDTHYKVHAEIQLLFFYELHLDYPRPRIICSSKSACYLCNLFFQLHGGFHLPRTHGRLYHKWILPYWLHFPVKHHQTLGVVTTGFKAALDNEIRAASKLKKGPCRHPNESVLLPSAYYPSSSVLSKNPTSVSPALRSTVRLRSPLAQERMPNTQSPKCTEPPLILPKTPLKPCDAADSDAETIIGPSAAKLWRSGVEDTSASDTVSLINIGHNKLPHCQSITLTTPSLHLQLDNLFLTVDFVHVLSGHLLITRAGDPAVESKDYSTVDIEDIPTSTELSLKCSHGSNELAIQFRSSHNVIICVMLVWD